MPRSALVYIAVGLSAIAAIVFALRDGDGPLQTTEGALMANDPAEMQAMLEGSMKKLRFHPSPQALPAVGFITDAGDEAMLLDFKGKYLLVNFWATWCAPCRKEMPMLSALQEAYAGERFEVLTIATGRNPLPAMEAFFDEIGVTNLPLHRDPKQALARSMDVIGLPVTVLIDPEGREIARMLGDADWNSDSARAMLERLIGADNS